MHDNYIASKHTDLHLRIRNTEKAAYYTDCVTRTRTPQVYFPVHSRICPRMHIAMYNTCIYVYINVHDRGAEGFAL